MNILQVKIKSERENFQIPVMGSEEAACYDCFASKIEHHEDGLVIVYLGFSTEIPVGWRADLTPRSNLTKHGWVIPNSPGTIDSDFRNEWQIRFRPLPIIKIADYNMFTEKKLSTNDFPYTVGDRVCQVRFERVNPVQFTLTESTNETERGLGGFGSTGLK